MEFRILGALEVVDDDGRAIEVRGGKLRTILALLVLRAGRTVSFDELADAAWPGSPPAGAANALQAQVSKLRRLLPGVTVESRDGGYALHADPRCIDAVQFAEAIALGHRQRTDGRAAEAAWRSDRGSNSGAVRRWPTSCTTTSPRRNARASTSCASRQWKMRSMLT